MEQEIPALTLWSQPNVEAGGSAHLADSWVCHKCWVREQGGRASQVSLHLPSGKSWLWETGEEAVCWDLALVYFPVISAITQPGLSKRCHHVSSEKDF